jgi:predicted nucleotidyltransferase
MEKVTETLHEVVELLDRLAIEYAIMGGFAVRAHGVPRPTYDVDLTLELPRESLDHLFRELRDYDFEIPEIYETGWVDQLKGMPLLKVRRYMGGETLDVDLFLAEAGFLTEVMERRRRVDAEGKMLWVITPEDIVLLKLLASRPRDLGDIEDVFFMQAPLDESYMRSWAKVLGVETELEEVIAEHRQKPTNP